MPKQKRPSGKRNKTGFVIGRAGFAKISAVEGIRSKPTMGKAGRGSPQQGFVGGRNSQGDHSRLSQSLSRVACMMRQFHARKPGSAPQSCIGGPKNLLIFFIKERGRANSHAQTTLNFHFIALSCVCWRLSLSRLVRNLADQNSVRMDGVVENRQPS
jgi:hypothetical protein